MRWLIDLLRDVLSESSTKSSTRLAVLCGAAACVGLLGVLGWRLAIDTEGLIDLKDAAVFVGACIGGITALLWGKAQNKKHE